jgi:hypothetical protein
LRHSEVENVHGLEAALFDLRSKTPEQLGQVTLAGVTGVRQGEVQARPRIRHPPMMPDQSSARCLGTPGGFGNGVEEPIVVDVTKL